MICISYNSVSCPDGFLVYYDSCYQIVSDISERKNLQDAQSDCLSRTNGTGFLTRIQSGDELEFISHRIEETSLLHRESVYIDMSYDSSGLYYDNGTQEVDTSGWDGPGPWASGYPSTDEEPCMALVFDGNEWRWLMADTSCSDVHSYVCEISRGGCDLALWIFILWEWDALVFFSFHALFKSNLKIDDVCFALSCIVLMSIYKLLFNNYHIILTAPGNWGPWSGWTQCGPDCENGTQTRSRDCNNPPPYLGGDDCIGNATETRSCTYLCPEGKPYSHIIAVLISSLPKKYRRDWNDIYRKW